MLPGEHRQKKYPPFFIATFLSSNTKMKFPLSFIFPGRNNPSFFFSYIMFSRPLVIFVAALLIQFFPSFLKCSAQNWMLDVRCGLSSDEHSGRIASYNLYMILLLIHPCIYYVFIFCMCYT